MPNLIRYMLLSLIFTFFEVTPAIASGSDSNKVDRDLPNDIYLAVGGTQELEIYDDNKSVPSGVEAIHLTLIKPGIAYQEGDFELSVDKPFYISCRQVTNIQYAYMQAGPYWLSKEAVSKRYVNETLSSWEQALGREFNSFSDAFADYLKIDHAPAILLDFHDSLDAANLASTRIKRQVRVSGLSEWHRYMRVFGVTGDVIKKNTIEHLILHDKYKIKHDLPTKDVFVSLAKIYNGEMDKEAGSIKDQVGVIWSMVWPTDSERTYLRSVMPDQERASMYVQPHSYFIRGGSLNAYKGKSLISYFSIKSMVVLQGQDNLLQGFYITLLPENLFTKKSEGEKKGISTFNQKTAD